jgi:hypothetical protein
MATKSTKGAAKQTSNMEVDYVVVYVSGSSGK